MEPAGAADARGTDRIELSGVVLAWLPDGDPATRCQVLRDLAGGSRQDTEAERQRVAAEGWGALCSRRRTPTAGGTAPATTAAASTPPRPSGNPRPA
ncbi:MAG: hypothetical protein ACXVGI_09510, partial [Mycobacteriaceae bacterium]